MDYDLFNGGIEAEPISFILESMWVTVFRSAVIGSDDNK